MGVKAAVVHDAPRHATIVLRTRSNNIADRYSVLETVASFMQHCDSLRGVAKTVTQVSALWGGPPYIDYTVVGSRFRVLLVWDEEPTEFDVCYDVHNAMKRLESAVQNVVDALEARSVEAVAAVYDAAGRVLRSEFSPDLVEAKSSRAKTLSIPGSRRSSVSTEPKKRKSLFGRIGSALKSSSDATKKPLKHEPLSPLPSEKESSVAAFGSTTALDNEVGHLELSDEVFKWTEFAPLQSDENDLNWFVELIKGNEEQEVRAEPPRLRTNISTPLTIFAPDASGVETGALSLIPPKDKTGTTPMQSTLPHNIIIESPASMAAESATTATSKTASVVVQSVNSTPQMIPTGVRENAESKGTIVTATEERKVASRDSRLANGSFSKKPDDTKEDLAVESLGALKDEAASTNASAQEEQDSAVRSRMNDFARSMQSGEFPTALRQVTATLQFLSTINPRRERETTTCANYYVAMKILSRNAALERELSVVLPNSPDAVQRHVECALLTMFLAELKHLLPRHRIAAMQVAIEKNAVVGNYGMCARWLRELIERAPERAKAELQNKLSVCARNGETNKHMPPTNRICYSTLQVVTSPYGKCSVCEAVFHGFSSGVSHGQLCGVCFVGIVHRRV
ncbi:Coatomer (COPI) alpha subunit [Gracilaria domingensis]|nr:Coatomer (COPI) alpha subunit [Gracilaria domingensis]